MNTTDLWRRAPRPLPPMPFEPRSYRAHTERQPEPEPATWWDIASDRLADWLTPGRAFAIYLVTLATALLGAWALS